MRLKNVVLISGANVNCNYSYPEHGAPYKELVSFQYYAENIKPSNAESWQKVGDVSVCIIEKGSCGLVTQ